MAEYLAGGVSLFDVCKKYGIRSPQNLQKLVEKAQAGGELRGYHGASRHRGGAYTTAADRERSCGNAWPTAAITVQLR